MDSNEPLTGNVRGDKMIKRSPRIILLFVIIILLLALGLSAFIFRYKATVFDSTVLLIDRWMGDVLVVHRDGTFSRIEIGRAVQGPEFLPQTVSKQDDVQVTPRIKWRSGKIYMHITVKPMTDALKKARSDRKSRYIIDLIDGDGFIVYTLEVPINKMRTIKDDKNKITALEYRTNRDIPRDEFRAIKGWKIR